MPPMNAPRVTIGGPPSGPGNPNARRGI
jgi:hypothetical protein